MVFIKFHIINRQRSYRAYHSDFAILIGLEATNAYDTKQTYSIHVSLSGENIQSFIVATFT